MKLKVRFLKLIWHAILIQGVNISILPVKFRCKPSIWFHLKTQTAWNSQFLEIFLWSYPLNSWTKTKRKTIFSPSCRSMSRKGVQRSKCRCTLRADQPSESSLVFLGGCGNEFRLSSISSRQFLRKFAVPFSRQENWPLFRLNCNFHGRKRVKTLLMYNHSISANKLDNVYLKYISNGFTHSV